MKILDRERLEKFCRRHADARSWIENWLADVETARWQTPQDVRDRYASRARREKQGSMTDMELRIIKMQEQYHRYLGEARRLARRDPDPATPEGGRLELLAKLVEDYEKERFKFRKPDPVAANLVRMRERGLRQKDIAEMVGGKNRASEVLSRKRPLTLAMIRALHEKLGIPSELLIRQPVAEYRVLAGRRKTGTRKQGGR